MIKKRIFCLALLIPAAAHAMQEKWPITAQYLATTCNADETLQFVQKKPEAIRKTASSIATLLPARNENEAYPKKTIRDAVDTQLSLFPDFKEFANKKFGAHLLVATAIHTGIRSPLYLEKLLKNADTDNMPTIGWWNISDETIFSEGYAKHVPVDLHLLERSIIHNNKKTITALIKAGIPRDLKTLSCTPLREIANFEKKIDPNNQAANIYLASLQSQ